MAAKGNFFDFRENLLRKPDREPATTPAREPVAVSQLTADIERALKTGLPATVAVKGELSNHNHHRGSGHHYFTLKDATACLDCVMFKSDAARLKFLPTDGMEVVATGRVSVYAQRGRYQLYATSLQPLGKGALEVAFQQMRAKLEAEGLFRVDRKRTLPRYPRRIVLVTSTNTAALQDMLKVLRRFPFLRLSVYHAPVQGDGSGAKIADAIRHVNAWRGAGTAQPADVIVLARGGGSLEDLWAFNEECVARAIVGSSLPVVTGIGHEVDVSIADLVADHHAHTPTEAAVVVTRDWLGAIDAIDAAGSRLARGVRLAVVDARGRLDNVNRHEFFRRPTDRVDRMRQRLDDLERQMAIAVERRVHQRRHRMALLATRLQGCDPTHTVHIRRQRLAFCDNRLTRGARDNLRRRLAVVQALDGKLTALSPVAVLKRGYTITTRAKDGTVVRSATELRKGDRIVTRFGDGEATSIVDDGRQFRLFE